MAVNPLTATTLSYKSATADPVEQTPSTGVDGNSVPNGGKTLLRVHNTDTSPHTLTMKYANKVDGQDVTSRTFTIAASSTVNIPVGPSSLFGSAAVFTVDSNLVKVSVLVLG